MSAAPRTPLRNGGSRLATLDEIREYRENLPDRACALLKKLVCSGKMEKADSLKAVEIIVESDFEELRQYEGYLVSADGGFLEPKVPFSCQHISRARGCYHSPGCDCGGDPCEQQAVAVVEIGAEEFPACERHRA